jgi:glycosyltransferase involved in cell wall biosynthesis
MRIVVYTVCYNEEKLLPFFLDYYSRFAAKIVIWDNCSSDATCEIAAQHKKTEIEIAKFDTGNEFREDVNRKIKNSCWKKDPADWAIVCDVDEFVYAPDIREFLARREEFDVFRPVGYNMVSEEFPCSQVRLLPEQVTHGVPDDNYSKMVLFKPRSVDDIDYSVGAHRARPIGPGAVKVFDARYFDAELKLLHYKNISFDYRRAKNKEYAGRVGAVSKKFNWNFHFGYDEETQRREFDAMLASAKPVLP